MLLQGEDWRTNIKKTHRIYNALGLQLRNKTPKRRVKAKLCKDRCGATWANVTKTMDFFHDQLAKIRILTVVDTFSRFSPVIYPRFTSRSDNVVEALDRACGRLGYPNAIRVDQGTEFVFRNLGLWVYVYGVTFDFSRFGNPTDNAFIRP